MNLVLKKQLTEINSNLKQQKNWYLEFLIDPSFQGVNNLFVFSFEDENGQESYYLPTAEVKYYNFMINGRNFLD